MPPEQPRVQFEEERFVPTTAQRPYQLSAFYRIAYALGAKDDKQATTFLLAGAVLIVFLAVLAYATLSPGANQRVPQSVIDAAFQGR